MRQDLISIVDYDDSWPRKFEEQRKVLEQSMSEHLVASIEHIGSTSVPGLPAKPIIDMLARVHEYEACAEVFAELAPLSWHLAPEPGDPEQRKWSLCYPSIEYRSHHLHVVEQGSTGWSTWLAFRDHLRSSPADCAEYARIKRGLSDRNDEDRVAYRAGKAPFITAVLERLQQKASAADS